MNFIDINCDMGENRGDDAAVIEYVSSINIACGGHAGNVETILRTLDLARGAGVLAGAHPGYPDPDGFGRVETGMGSDEVVASVLAQLRVFSEAASSLGISMSHIKLHGALYNRAAADYSLMSALVMNIVRDFGNVPIYTLAGSASEKAVDEGGCILFREGFADRAYDDNSCLVSRSVEGAVLHSVPAISQRVLDIVNGKPIKTIGGKEINLDIDTICVHGDTPGAVEMAAGIYRILTENEILVRRYDAL